MPVSLTSKTTNCTHSGVLLLPFAASTVTFKVIGPRVVNLFGIVQQIEEHLTQPCLSVRIVPNPVG